MKTRISMLALLLAFCISAEETYGGRYESVDAGVSLGFTIDETESVGMIEFRGKIYQPGSWDFLGKYGGDQIIEIVFTDTDSVLNIIRLFIVKNDGEFVLCAGYLLRQRPDATGKAVFLENAVHLEMTFSKP